MSENEKPKRRVRYKGTHPRKFSEKYKEQANDPEIKAKLEAKGKTLAGTHRPIMVNEILEILDPRPGKIIVDVTLGFGGHSSAFLEKLIDPSGNSGLLIAFDRDPIERPKTIARLKEKFASEHKTDLQFKKSDWQVLPSLVVVPRDFAQAEESLRELGLLGKVDGLLGDFGLSSMQIDDPTRGFSFKVDGPLDLRMNPQEGEPASAVLKKISETDLTRLLEEESDEPRAKWCAKAILARQKKTPIETTKDLKETVEAWIKTLGPNTRAKEGDTPIRRVFQALRMRVNEEGLQLDRLLDSVPRILKPGGRMVALSFHSGEDRRVKKSIQNGFRLGAYKAMSDEATRPTFDEQKSNSRSTSTKLRWAEKA